MSHYTLVRSIEHTVFYIRTFLKDRKIASVTPSSRFAVKKICSTINFGKDNVIVECGPGNGVLSRAILKQMTTNSKLILVETNNGFARHLKQTIDDVRVHIACENAMNIRRVLQEFGISHVDYAILGIPFSLTDVIQNHLVIVRNQQVLKEGGKLIVYQFSLRIRKYLKQHFQDISTTFEILNIPPMFIFEALHNRRIV